MMKRIAVFFILFMLTMSGSATAEVEVLDIDRRHDIIHVSVHSPLKKPLEDINCGVSANGRLIAGATQRSLGAFNTIYIFENSQTRAHRKLEVSCY